MTIEVNDDQGKAKDGHSRPGTKEGDFSLSKDFAHFSLKSHVSDKKVSKKRKEREKQDINCKKISSKILQNQHI